MVDNIVAFNSGAGVEAETQVLPYIALIPVPDHFRDPDPFPRLLRTEREHELHALVSKRRQHLDIRRGGVGSHQNDLTGDPAFKR